MAQLIMSVDGFRPGSKIPGCYFIRSDSDPVSDGCGSFLDVWIRFFV